MQYRYSTKNHLQRVALQAENDMDMYYVRDKTI